MSVEGEVPLYDALSDDYDRFVNWESRLAYEMPFIERILREADARRVIDVACGTGMHAIELARRGYDVVGADLSAPMIERAKENASTLRQAQDSAAGFQTHFIVAGFGELAEKLALSKACPEPSRRAEGLICHVNLIPLNPIVGSPYQPSSRKMALAFQRELERQGIPTTMRVGRGIDIQAGCGQLRG
jgi:SAM-dependent methyltransferase